MEHVLVYGAASDTALGRMCARGLRSIGHDVTYFGRDFQTVPLLGWKTNVDEVHQKFIKYAVEYQPTLILIIKGYTLSRSVLSRVKNETNAKVVNWNPDNPFQIRSQEQRAEQYLNTISEYDIVFTWGEFLQDKLIEEGARRTEFLPFGWDPTVHGPADSKPEFEFDIAFFGIWSKKRERILRPLSDLDLHLRGNYWKIRCWDRSLRNCYRGGKFGADEYSSAMASAKIVVNIVADHNIPDHNMRTFEAPSTGSVLATTRTEGQKRFFDEETEVLMYDNGEELREKIEWLLDNDQKREEMARRGQSAVEGHTYTDRMKRLLELL